MKKQKRAIRGPKVQYFNHNFGVVNARRSKMVTVFLPTLITIFVIGGGFIGLDALRSATVAQRADDKPKVTEQKQAAKKDTGIRQVSKQAREDKTLAKSIEKKLKTMPKTTMWAVSVRDLKSDRMANINADQEVEAGGLHSLFLVAPLEKKLNADYWKSSLGKQTIATCVDIMIKKSETDCTNAVGNYAGWKTIDAYNQTIGFKNTKIVSKDNQKTTARETANLLYSLQNSQILGDKARRAFFDALYEQDARYGIPAGCSKECLVGNKTGEGSNIKHDAAIVTHSGGQYVVVIMSSGASWSQLADVASAIDEVMVP